MRFAAKTLCAALAVAAAMCSFAEKREHSIRADFASQLEDVTVFIDGARAGATPLTLFSLEPGAHHARYEKDGYESADDFFSILPEMTHIERHAVLEPVKGLLLVTTDPAGCDVSLDGLSLGDTPRLITSLDARGTYRLLLKKAGYQSRTVEVRFNGREPLVRHERMIRDSGVVTVESEPAGAQIFVNGLQRGVSPLTLSDIPKGRAKLRIEKAGYLPQTREIVIAAGDEQNVRVVLEGEPGSLYLTSVPQGARFYIDGKPHGPGPHTLSPFPAGKHSVRAELDGYGVVTREISIGLGESVSEEFRLESIRGRLEVRTVPSGALVIVDGRAVGTTKGGESPTDRSDVLTIENLDVGEHTVVVRKDGYGEVVYHPVVENSSTAQLSARLKRVFKPNIRLTTPTGVYSGVYVDSTPDTFTIEVSMGITRAFRREDILKAEPIGD